MSEVADFKPGLEGVVAVETEIAEPDREGGALRYRGVDIEELVGHVPVRAASGACSSTTTSSSSMPEPGAVRADRAHGQRARRPPGRDRAALRRLEARQAERDLRRAGARRPRPALGADDGDRRAVGARRRRRTRLGRGRRRRAGARRRPSGSSCSWRGEADPRHVKAIDTYWICTAEHGLNASTFTARVVASTGADCGAALSSAVGALSGPLHGGAPAHVKPMLEEVAAMGDAEQLGATTCSTPAERIMGFGHRVYRAEDPRSRHPQANRAGARLAADRGRGAARGGGARRARATSSRARARDERRVLLGGRARHRRTSRRRSRPRCSRARASPAGRRTSSSRSASGGSFRPSARYVGPARSSLSTSRDARRGGCRGRTPRAGR